MAHIKSVVKLHAAHGLQDFGADPIVVESKLKHCHVLGEVILVHTSKKSQAVSQACPDAFDCVDVNLPFSVTILVLGPGFGVVDGLPGSRLFLAFEPEVGAVLVGENTGLLGGLFGEDFLEGVFLRVPANPETGSPSFAADHAHDRRAVAIGGRSFS